jgi:hypothetical protein
VVVDATFLAKDGVPLFQADRRVTYLGETKTAY